MDGRMKRPDDEFRGKSWDQDGKPVAPDQRPPDAPKLPLLALEPGEVMPPGVSAHLLGGNWYGSGPEIVLWDGLSEMHLNFPLWDRKQMPRMLRRLAEAGAIKRKDPRGVARRGGVFVKG